MTGGMLIISSYVLLLFFIVTFFYKARKIAKLPNHLRWELSPIPGEKGKSHYGGSYLEEFEWWTKPREKSVIDEAIYMFKEIFFLRGVYEYNRKLWYLSLPFHFGLYLLTGMVGLMFLSAILLSAGVIETSGILETGIYIFAVVGYILGGLGTIGLIFRRLVDPDLKNFNTGGTIFNLLFLVVVFISGFISLIAVPDFSDAMTRLAGAVITADTSIVLPGSITLHWSVSLLFLAYLPYTKMLHFLAKYFTYHEIRWNDSPMKGDARLEGNVKKLLEQPVTWAASHLNADGKKNWIDIVSEEKKK